MHLILGCVWIVKTYNKENVSPSISCKFQISIQYQSRPDFLAHPDIRGLGYPGKKNTPTIGVN